MTLITFNLVFVNEKLKKIKVYSNIFFVLTNYKFFYMMNKNPLFYIY